MLRYVYVLVARKLPLLGKQMLLLLLVDRLFFLFIRVLLRLTNGRILFPFRQ